MAGAGRVFTAADDGTEMSLGIGRQIELVRSEELTSDARYMALPPAVLENLKRDLGSFTDAQRFEAMARYEYVKAIKGLPVAHRDKSEFVIPTIESTAQTERGRLVSTPTFRTARRWYVIWVVAGYDLRALISNLAACGRREPRYEPWVYEEVHKAIDEVYATELKGSIRQTLLRARKLIRLRADRDGLTLPGLSYQVIGRNVVETEIAKRGAWDILVRREGRAEAERLLRFQGAGPPGEYPLGEVEADHTTIDLMISERGVVLGRPYLTVLIDRYSRMIIGFCISFEPPSWVSVMEALRHAVYSKEDELKHWAEYSEVAFVFSWEALGAPDLLITDQGLEFLSASMAATESALRMRHIQVPRASGDKKAKVESHFDSLNRAILHRLQGSTFSNVTKRGKYRSEEHAIFSLDDIRYLVTRWVVDGYNREVHPTTGRIPAEAWREGMDRAGLKLAPPPREIFAPLVGKVLPRKLRKEGVRYNNLRWNSNAFQALRARIGTSCDVVIRIDPLDLRTAYVLDPDEHVWIKGDLIAERAVEHLTLSQYEHLRQKLDEAKETDPDYELKLAQGSQALWDFVDKRMEEKGIVPKHVSAFITSKTRAAEHVHGVRKSAADSNGPIKSHDIDGPVLSPPPDPRGPYRETVLRTPNPYPAPDSEGRYPGERVGKLLPAISPSAEPPSTVPVGPSGAFAGRHNARR
jgi:putative transposase